MVFHQLSNAFVGVFSKLGILLGAVILFGLCHSVMFQVPYEHKYLLCFSDYQQQVHSKQYKTTVHRKKKCN
jgi:hypothetical protein